MNVPKKPLLPVLIVDDEEDALQSYRSILRLNGMDNIILCKNSLDVMPLMETTEISVIILDLNMPGITGKELLDQINENYPGIPVIIITAVDRIDMAVNCMKSGAFDYMTKPVEKSRLCISVERALEVHELKAEVLSLSKKVFSRELQKPEIFSGIVSNNESIKSIFRYIEAIAGSSKPVLITGESGSGKELFARAIFLSKQHHGEFVPVNVAGLDENMFSDTLFGHTRGAFTGADTVRQGLINQAENGVLFLDEIGDMDMRSQVKLLRLLQEKEYSPLGSDIVKTSNALIIAATNVDLEKKVEENQFRKDLYYRIATHQIHIPALRDRKDDIPLLLDHFLNEACLSMSIKLPRITQQLRVLLDSYHFPGNVRELQSLIFDAIARQENGTLPYTFFHEYIQKKTGNGMSDLVHTGESSPICLKNRFPSLKEVEDFLMREAMERSDGNQTIAAQLLGISQSTLSRRFKDKDY